MCYPSPGPRCANHVNKRLKKLEQELDAAKADNKTDKIATLQKEQKVLQDDFSGTMTGQKFLNNRISKEPNPVVAHALTQYKIDMRNAYKDRMDKYRASLGTASTPAPTAKAPKASTTAPKTPKATTPKTTTSSASYSGGKGGKGGGFGGKYSGGVPSTPAPKTTTPKPKTTASSASYSNGKGSKGYIASGGAPSTPAPALKKATPAPKRKKTNPFESSSYSYYGGKGGGYGGKY